MGERRLKLANAVAGDVDVVMSGDAVVRRDGPLGGRARALVRGDVVIGFRMCAKPFREGGLAGSECGMVTIRTDNL
jgi:hypothetical protein